MTEDERVALARSYAESIKRRCQQIADYADQFLFGYAANAAQQLEWLCQDAFEEKPRQQGDWR